MTRDVDLALAEAGFDRREIAYRVRSLVQGNPKWMADSIDWDAALVGQIAFTIVHVDNSRKQLAYSLSLKDFPTDFTRKSIEADMLAKETGNG